MASQLGDRPGMAAAGAESRSTTGLLGPQDRSLRTAESCRRSSRPTPLVKLGEQRRVDHGEQLPRTTRVTRCDATCRSACSQASSASTASATDSGGHRVDAVAGQPQGLGTQSLAQVAQARIALEAMRYVAEEPAMTEDAGVLGQQGYAARSARSGIASPIICSQTMATASSPKEGACQSWRSANIRIWRVVAYLEQLLRRRDASRLRRCWPW